VPAGILHVAVPQQIISDDGTLISSPDWKKLVFDSRGQKILGRFSKNIEHYDQAGLLIGEVCSRNTEKIRRDCKEPDDIVAETL
jgi:hypothetical protein